MFRKILAGVIAIIATFAMISILQATGQAFYPPPEDLDFNDVAALSEWIPTLPIGALLSVLISYFAGAFTGAIVGGWIAGEKGMVYAAIIGTLVLTATVVNLVVLPVHPLWFAVAAVIGIPLFAWLGGRLSPKRKYG